MPTGIVTTWGCVTYEGMHSQGVTAPLQPALLRTLHCCADVASGCSRLLSPFQGLPSVPQCGRSPGVESIRYWVSPEQRCPIAQSTNQPACRGSPEVSAWQRGCMGAKRTCDAEEDAGPHPRPLDGSV